MKISVLTPTYNREQLLGKLYKSLIRNMNYGVDIEWLIMDDGSTDNTKNEIKKYVSENKIEIKYFYQDNQGKMSAINNLVKNANGDLIIECDSDDYFTDDAFKIIKEEYNKNKNDDLKAYAMCFLKYNQNGNNMGKMMKKERTTMFDLYFKEEENGEKALVFYTKIRKKYSYKLENNEKFVTEARMYHEMDLSYNIICINKPIMICEYQKEGYTQNIKKQFIENPYGYYEYFKEILKRNTRKVKFNKRLYAVKHYILFTVLTKKKINIKEVNDILNKVLIIILFLPGKIKTYAMLKSDKNNSSFK